MVSFSEIDRTKPIGYQTPCWLSKEALDLFPNLALIGQEREWCNWTPAELTEEAERNEYAIKKFRRKLDCCSIVDGLLRSDPESVRQGIEKVSTHVTGGALEKFLFRHAYKVRSDAELQKRIQPVMNCLIEAACRDLKKYVENSSQEALDDSYRNFRVFSTTVARLTPAVAPALHQEFSGLLGSRKNELQPFLYLASLRALGYLSNRITEWDEQYVTVWRCDPASSQGWARALDIAAYNAPPRIGWRLMTMHPSDTDRFLRRHKDSIVRSLIAESHCKCERDPAINAAWLAARFLKLHLTLHVLVGNHAYGRLPHDLALKVLSVAKTARKEMRKSAENFDGKLEVEKIAGSVEAFLRDRCQSVRDATRNVTVTEENEVSPFVGPSGVRSGP